MSWENIIKQNGFKAMIKGEHTSRMRNWNVISDDNGETIFPTREAAFENLKYVMRTRGNPRPWTVMGDQYIGRCVVLDRGIFEVLGAPSYEYQIIGEDEEPDDNKNPYQVHDFNSPEATKRKLEGKNPVPETSSGFKEDNR
jgi:hypothetical protein|tara:strand:- start:338 stop:760 length:423 start_codon:yes stop_codon:yes gene_type:complete